MIEVIMIVFGAVLLMALVYTFIMPLKKNGETKNNQDEKIEDDYIKPEFKPLTQEQIEDIHSRGKITPAEKVMEWEKMNSCIFDDEMWTSAWRCKKFKSCHDCLVDYSSEQDEYVPSIKK